MYSGKDIRQKYLNFFKSKGHVIIPSSSLVPENDSSTLFISSGMQPLVPYLLGKKHPEANRLCNSQKSFRAEDIEKIGDNYHTTFFEMLGNWSLGDYFKKEQLSWIFSFLTDELCINPNRLYVTVFRGNKNMGIEKDTESVEIWEKLLKGKGIEVKDIDCSEKNGMQDGKIFYYDENKNWWSRSGLPINMPIGELGGPDSEIFYDLGTDLKKHENSRWADLPCHVNCDCGRFIEIANSVFMEFKKTENGFEKIKQRIVDFGGGLERTVMIAQGLDNVFETDLFINIIKKVEQLSGKKYRENIKAFEVIVDHLKASTFIMGDDKGISPSNIGQGYIVRRLIRRAIRFGRQLGIKKDSWTKEIAKVVACDYDDIYPELKRNINFVIDQLKDEGAKFNKTIEKGLKEFGKIHNQKIISGENAFNLYQTYGFPIEMTKELAEERGLRIDEEGFKKEMERHRELSRTASAGMFKGGLVDVKEKTMRLHTATHLMLAALRKVLGNHVVQMGSNITLKRLRFDFSHSVKMTLEQIQQVESIVNDAIEKNLPVKWQEMTLKKAREINAIGVFELKYGEKVRVYTIGDEGSPVSREICGGPHVKNTGVLGHFKIQKEKSLSAGVRRIKAILE
ncbi:alanine--tRNA ligase [Candidatus Babeliales bacterium]|nr:alanine--tRNA ligase [Candidatus Babeliales bacterium]